MGYNFTAQWLKGTSNEAVDALEQPVDGDDLGEQEVDTHHFQAAVYQALTLQRVRMSAASQHDMENLHVQGLRHHAMQDQTYQTLKTIITEGFPNQKCSLPNAVSLCAGTVCLFRLPSKPQCLADSTIPSKVSHVHR